MKKAVLWVVAPFCLVKFTDLSQMLAASFNTAGAVSTFEMPVNFYETKWCYNPNDRHIQPII
jgi:hypothetical protein